MTAALSAPQIAATFQPLGDRLLVERIEDCDGLIVAPCAYKQRPIKARIVAAGPGKWEDGERLPMWVKPGDVVCFSGNIDRYSWGDVEAEGASVLITQNDLLGIVDASARVEFVVGKPDFEDDHDLETSSPAKKKAIAQAAAKFTPVGDRVLIRRDDAPEKIGLIYVPDVAKEKPLKARVMRTISRHLKAGQGVYVPLRRCLEITIDGIEFMVMREGEIIATC